MKNYNSKREELEEEDQGEDETDVGLYFGFTSLLSSCNPFKS